MVDTQFKKDKVRLTSPAVVQGRSIDSLPAWLVGRVPNSSERKDEVG